MKRIYIVLVVLLISVIFTEISYAQNKVKITYTRPPLNELRLSHMWDFELNNLTNEEVYFYLFGSLKEKQVGLIATGTTMSIKLNPNEKRKFKISDLPQTPDISYPNSDPRYKEALIRMGKLPNGDYTVCVIAKEFGTNEEISIDECFEQEVDIEIDYTLELLTPDNESSLDSSGLPIFSWTSPIPKPEGEILYTLKIFEINENQNPVEIVKSNKVFTEVKNIKSNFYNYRTTDKKFQEGKTYYWNISIILIGKPLITSPLHSFFPFASSFISNCSFLHSMYQSRYCFGDSYRFFATTPNGTLTWQVTSSTNGILGQTSGTSNGTSHNNLFSTDPNHPNDVTYTITYSFNFSNPSCTDITNRTTSVTFYKKPIININNSQICLNLSSPPYDISSNFSVSPIGGRINASGPGITYTHPNFIFTPNTDLVGLNSISVSYEFPALSIPGQFGGPRGCIVNNTFTIFVSDISVNYSSAPNESIICEGSSQQIYLNGIPVGAIGFNFEWHSAVMTGTNCPIFPGPEWTVLTGINSPSFNTSSLPVGKYCFICKITDPCNNTSISSVSKLEIKPQNNNVVLSAENLSICSDVPPNMRTANIFLNGYTGNVVWSSVPPVINISTDPYIFSAVLDQTTTFTATINSCNGNEENLEITVLVIDPPPPALICIQPHIIPGILPACCTPYPNPCNNNLLIQKWCDANITLLRSDTRELFPSGYTIKWFYFIDEHFDYGLDLSQFENNNISTYSPLTDNNNWTEFIPGGDNRFWNTNPLEFTKFFKVIISGPAGCGSQTYYGGLFVNHPIPDFSISEINNNVYQNYPCTNPVNFNFNLSNQNINQRPLGFNVTYSWNYTYNSQTTNLGSGVWPYGVPFPGIPVNITEPGILRLTLTNGCHSRTTNLPIYTIPPSIGITGPCCICEDKKISLTATGGFTSYNWTTSDPNVTISNISTDGQRVSVILNGTPNANSIFIFVSALSGMCPVSTSIEIKICK
ncbi:MAG TPA: hypothetical protein PLG90_10275 [Ignavibacteria bacterium]|nr:hypothetical protein [Ignavibacteria bacterium]